MSILCAPAPTSTSLAFPPTIHVNTDSQEDTPQEETACHSTSQHPFSLLSLQGKSVYVWMLKARGIVFPLHSRTLW